MTIRTDVPAHPARALRNRVRDEEIRPRRAVGSRRSYQDDQRRAKRSRLVVGGWYQWVRRHPDTLDVAAVVVRPVRPGRR